VDENDWGLVLKSDGDVMAYRMSDLFATGSLLPGQAPAQILAFTTFHLPGAAGSPAKPGGEA
jgi:hypothetical protein